MRADLSGKRYGAAMNDEAQCVCGHTWLDHEASPVAQGGELVEQRQCGAIVLPTAYYPYPEPPEYCHCQDFRLVAQSAFMAERGLAHDDDAQADTELWEIENEFELR